MQDPTPDQRLRLPLDRPLDLRLTFGIAGAGLTHRWDRQALWAATRTADGPATLRLEVAGDQLLADAWGPGSQAALAQVPARCGMLDDVTDFRPQQPLVQQLWQRFPGLRIGRTGRVFDALLPAVLGQRVTTAAADRSLRELTWRFGERAPGPGRLWLQPTADALAGLGYAAFHPSGVERQRALVILRAARLGRRLEALAALPRRDAYAALTAIKGIGPWTAPLIMAQACGDADAVPIGDLHLPRTIAWHLAREADADDARMVELLRPFIGHRYRVIRLLFQLGGRGLKTGPRAPVIDFRER